MSELGHPGPTGQDPRTTPGGTPPPYGAPAHAGAWPPPQHGTQAHGGQAHGGQAHGGQVYDGPVPPSAPAYGAPSYAGAVPPGSTVPPPGATGPMPSAVPPARRTGRLRIGVAGLVAGALIGGGAGAGVVALLDPSATGGSSATAAQSVVIKDPESATTATAAAAKAAPSVVTVYVTSGSGAGSGSGVVLTDDGYVLTNNHVATLEGQATDPDIQVRTADGTLYDATIVGTDPSSDLAVLKLEGASDLTPATFADSDDVQVGDVAVAIGAPLGLENTVTDGIVSATNRAVQTGSGASDATVIDAIQTDAAINPGNSGGALVNAAGEVIGINTAIASVATSDLPGQQSAQSGSIGVGFAIPSNTAERIAKEIMANGSADHAVLGVSARTATDDANSEVGAGAEVVSVQEGSAAADAGLQAGDVITAVGDRPVTTSTELTAAVRSATPGEEVTLTVRRGGSTESVQVTLGTSTS
ncbi:trypsin-like peptidase domain-containing protein [Geodermatophilus sp. SYSU D00815]